MNEHGRQSRKLINFSKNILAVLPLFIFQAGLSRVSRSGLSQTGRNKKMQLTCVRPDIWAFMD